MHVVSSSTGEPALFLIDDAYFGPVQTALGIHRAVLGARDSLGSVSLFAHNRAAHRGLVPRRVIFDRRCQCVGVKSRNGAVGQTNLETNTR